MKKVNQPFIFSIPLLLTSCLTGFYPPIRTYNLSVNPTELSIKVRQLTDLDPTLNVRFTDTIGSKENGYAYYMNFTVKSANVKYWYTLKYDDQKTKTGHSHLKVIMAADSTNWIICY
jgi:hypothetical protein